MMEEGSRFLGRSCTECITYQWSEEGVEGRSKDGRKKYRSVSACIEAGAKPTPRIKGAPLECWQCPKVKDQPNDRKSPHYAIEITDQTWQIIAHFEECEATNTWPDCPIVRQNAALIKRIRDEHKRAEHGKGMAHLFSILMMGSTGRGR